MNEEDIHGKMKTWFLKMGVDSYIPVNNIETDCKRSCPPQLRDTWRYIIEHVRPADEIRYMKKVLLLHRLKQKKKTSKTFKPLKRTVSSIAELEKLEKLESLQKRVYESEKEICLYESAIKRLITTLKEQEMKRINSEEIQRKDTYFTKTLKFKMKNSQDKLFKMIDLMESIEPISANIQRILSSSSKVCNDMLIKEYLALIDDSMKSQYTTVLTTNDLIKKHNQLVSSPTQLKDLFSVLLKMLKESSCTMTKFIDSSDVIRNITEIRTLHANYINNLQHTLKNEEDAIIEIYLKEKRMEENLKTIASQIKECKNKLYSILTEKNRCFVSNEEFNSWISSEMKIISLEMKKHFILNCKLDVLKPDEKDVSVNMKVAEKEYFDKIENLKHNVEQVMSRIVDYMGYLSSDRVFESLSKLKKDAMSMITESFPDGFYGQGENLALKDSLIKEYDRFLKIPPQALCSTDQLHVANEFSHAQLIEMMYMIYWLWLMKNQIISLKDFQPTFKYNSMESMKNDYVNHNLKFKVETENCIMVTKEKSVNTEKEVERCRNLLNLWLDQQNIGNFIPNHVLFENESFRSWYMKFKIILNHFKFAPKTNNF